MPGKSGLSDFAENPGVGWSGIFSFAGSGLQGLANAAIVAAIVLLLAAGQFLGGVLPPWLVVLLGMALLGACFLGWILCSRQIQALEDYPLSKIASAPQGYARLQGRAAAFGQPLDSPLTHQPCCWFSYKVEERRRDRTDGSVSEVESDTSIWSFMINDGSGECVVDPVGAKLVPVRVDRWNEGDFLYTERLILIGDPLFVLGEFATSGSTVSGQDVEFRVGQLIAEWKKDMPALVKGYDLDGDGVFSEQEWTGVREAARREVEGELARNPPQPQNTLAKPRDGRPLIISAKSRARLERDLKIWAWIYLGALVLGVVVLAGWFFRR